MPELPLGRHDDIPGGEGGAMSKINWEAILMYGLPLLVVAALIVRMSL